MTEKKRGWRLPAKWRRASIVTVIIIATGLLVFTQIIRPDQNAKSYTGRLSAASKPLEACFEKLAKTTELDIYYAPDIPLEAKQQNTSAILSQIGSCRQELANFDDAARQLMTLHLAGYTKTYRDAKVNQRQAFDVIGQSNDVLNQYADMAGFLNGYYGHISAFLSHTHAAGELGNTYVSTTDITALEEQAADLRARAGQVSQLKAPAGFEAVKQATHNMLTTAADGLDSLAVGYGQGGDYNITAGYADIDEALTAYDSTVINLPFEQLTTSYIPKQVLQLPVKVENLLAVSSE